MHELGIVFHVIKTIEEVAAEQELTKVSSVTLEVGEVSTVIVEYLEDCWDWIEEKARELLSGGSGAVWHGQVFRWARDYFVDRVFEKKEQEEKEEQERAKKQRAERPKKRVARTKTKRKAAPRDADSPEALAMDTVSVPAEAPAAPKPEADPVPGIQLDLFAEASR